MVNICAALKIKLMSWRPSASLPVLQQRAQLYHRIRQFFLERDVLEVDVPVLNEYATVDPFIESIHCEVMGQSHYLQTSPEFFLKRLLTAYQHDIYCLGKAFRQGERGKRHRPEFTMLEWYRVGWTEQQLITEVQVLLSAFFPEKKTVIKSYREVFQQALSIDPHTATIAQLKACAVEMIEGDFGSEITACNDKNTWLDILFTHGVEPTLEPAIVAIYDYPASQSALAKIAADEQGQCVAKRFEIYVDGMELANGYWELTDGKEQQARFEKDNDYRQQHGLPVLPYDQALVSALTEGEMPACAGVALGVDRLLMCLLETDNIAKVVSF
jgi:lysyl-tRNA synthetase class 2